MIDDAAMEKRINEWFDENYESLRVESGHALAPAAREEARRQVLHYWRKLRDVAMSITDTEVKLNLPFQTSPAGRTFGIEGIVDIVREDTRTVMYDIKTHDAEYVLANKQIYAEQLNVYAYIWERLRQQELNETNVIVTTFSHALKAAFDSNDPERIEAEFAKWEPLIRIEFDESQVQETIRRFGEIVDCIEDRRFAAPKLSYLNRTFPGTNARFGTRVCRNCDARFSCSAYRDYALGSRGKVESRFRTYFSDYGDDDEREDWINAALNASPLANLLEEDAESLG
jgi:hypothetical protein